jgi:hypothetical protein
MRTRTILTSLALAFGSLALAPGARAEGDCAITYTRTACPGQEAESYKKCDGEQTCTKGVPATSEEQCAAAALEACANDRLTVTESKVITAKFKGQELKSKSGKPDFCLDYAKRSSEFNQCKK